MHFLWNQFFIKIKIRICCEILEKVWEGRGGVRYWSHPFLNHPPSFKSNPPIFIENFSSHPFYKILKTLIPPLPIYLWTMKTIFFFYTVVLILWYFCINFAMFINVLLKSFMRKVLYNSAYICIVYGNCVKDFQPINLLPLRGWG